MPAATGGVETGGMPPVATGGGVETGGQDPGTGGDGTGGTVVDNGPPYYPTTVTLDDARASYDAWKAIHTEDCGGGVWRVPWENAKLDATVSEGIGYGMLLAVAYDDQTLFDGLLEYGKLMRAAFQDGFTNNGDNGLMNWLRYGCDAHRDTKYSDYPDNAASDADLDVAMALLMAQCKWGDSGYGTEATVIINAIKDHMFMEYNGLQVLQPGDSSWFDELGAGCVNYSYFAPAYYRAYAEHVPGDAAFWNQAADDTYALLESASNGSTGLVRNWGSADGNGAAEDCHNAYNRAGSYGDDAARTPWRVATDFEWYGETRAKAWTDRATDWVKGEGVSELVQWYYLDGSPDTDADTWDDHTAINVGPFAVGAMTYDQATVDEFAADLIAIPAASGNHDAEYFPRMLKALSLLNLTGQFTVCGGS